MEKLTDFAQVHCQFKSYAISLQRNLPYIKTYIVQKYAKHVPIDKKSKYLYGSESKEILDVSVASELMNCMAAIAPLIAKSGSHHINLTYNISDFILNSFVISVLAKWNLLLLLPTTSSSELESLKEYEEKETSDNKINAEKRPISIFKESTYLNSFGGNSKYALKAFARFNSNELTSKLLKHLKSHPFSFPENNPKNQQIKKELFELAFKTGGNELGGWYVQEFVYLLHPDGNNKEITKSIKRAEKANLHYACLGNYALFMELEGRKKKAIELYEQAIIADPKNANILGNYAKLQFVLGEQKKALYRLEEAEKFAVTDELKLELAFYRYAHVRPYPLMPLKKLVANGVLCLDWPLEENLKAAIEDGHPNPILLRSIVDVISKGDELDFWEEFPEWWDA